ncbi:MAG: ABC1 kinase family protein, partial [Candidatus Sericytochromatia bacterium]
MTDGAGRVALPEGPWQPGDARWQRIAQIGDALSRHGLGALYSKLRLAHCTSWRCRLHCTLERWFGRVSPDMPWPIAVRDSLVELGPAFIKAGQILSVRSDLIPAPLAASLKTLQSDVPPVPFEAVRPAIEAAMGQPIDKAFRRFDPRPLAAASIAQVHEAELPDGTRVAVKVKRPGIDAVVERDLENLVWLARRMERHLARTRPYHPVAAATELATYTRRELDFNNEGRVASRLAAHFASWPEVVIPAIHHHSRDLLVMDFVAGVPVDDLATLDAWGVDRRKLVATAVDCTIEQILGVGLFHADPHPGNMHVTPDGRLVILD